MAALSRAAACSLVSQWGEVRTETRVDDPRPAAMKEVKGGWASGPTNQTLFADADPHRSRESPNWPTLLTER
jgi:hypothetical protein